MITYLAMKGYIGLNNMELTFDDYLKMAQKKPINESKEEVIMIQVKLILEDAYNAGLKDSKIESSSFEQYFRENKIQSRLIIVIGSVR